MVVTMTNILTTTKICRDCGVEKSLDDFHKAKPTNAGKTRWASYCKPCQSVRVRRCTVEARAEGRDWTTKLARRNSHVKHYHGITLAEYDAMVELQCGVCAICKQPPIGKGRLSIDHDHDCCPGRDSKSCGKCIRGLLCLHCNSGLGFFKDDAKLMLAAIEYLNSYWGID